MLATTKPIEPGSPVVAGPDITHPVARKNDGRGQAILFADVSRSMLLHERLGDAEARIVIDELLSLAEKAVRAHHGRVVKTIGDEILAVLPSADAAARAARDLLVSVDACKERAGIRPGMHVGLHAGEFVEREGDVVGDAVNVASSLTAYAHTGQILTTSVSAGGLSPLVRLAMRPLGAFDIRGRREQIQVEEIAWRESADEETTFTESTTQRSPAPARLVLRLDHRQWVVGPLAKHLAIGRDPCSDIPVCATEASRNHGQIEYRNGGFFYTDMSLNGSYVTFGSTGETHLRRSQVLLSGKGIVCFGHPAAGSGPQLAFCVETLEH